MSHFELDQEYFVGDRSAVADFIAELCSELLGDERIPDEAKGPIAEKLLRDGRGRLESKLKPIRSSIDNALNAARDISKNTIDQHIKADASSASSDSIKRYTQITRERIQRAVMPYLSEYPLIADRVIDQELRRCEAEIYAKFDPLLTFSISDVDPAPTNNRKKPRYGDIPSAQRPDCEEFLRDNYQEEIENGSITRTMVRKNDNVLHTAIYERYKLDPEAFDKILPRSYARRK